jgi:acyl-coenzyme A synthetase/AMP-(fatty) acid ligase
VDAGSAKGLVAFIAGEVDSQEIRAALQAQLPSYMVPKRICVVAELPQTLNGKVDRKKLADLLANE